MAPQRRFAMRLLVFGLAFACPLIAHAGKGVGKSAPDLTLKGMSETDSTRLADLKGEVVLIDFWASWCAPCKRTLPALHRLKAEVPAAAFLAISVDEDKAKAKRFLAGSSPEGLITLLDTGGKAAEAFSIEGMPTALLIDRKGVLRFRHDGYTERDIDKLKLELQVLLKEK